MVNIPRYLKQLFLSIVLPLLKADKKWSIEAASVSGNIVSWD